MWLYHGNFPYTIDRKNVGKIDFIGNSTAGTYKTVPGTVVYNIFEKYKLSLHLIVFETLKKHDGYKTMLYCVFGE